MYAPDSGYDATIASTYDHYFDGARFVYRELPRNKSWRRLLSRITVDLEGWVTGVSIDKLVDFRSISGDGNHGGQSVNS